MSLRLAVIVSHPIQHFAPWHREVARRAEIDLRVFFCCDWGVEEYVDEEFGRALKWDVPLTEGYAFEFLPIARRPRRMSFLQVDNPSLGERLSWFDPHVVKIFGYQYRTNWRAASWAARHERPVLLYSDSNARASVPAWKRPVKDAVVRFFYDRVDAALTVGDNNRDYHRRYGLPEERLFWGCLPIDRERLLGSVPDRAAARRRVRERHGIPADAFVALLCGKYAPRKRPLDLVAACADSRLWALLVGEGPERARVEAFLAERAGRNAVLTGFVNQAEIADYYAAADVLTVTSEADPHPLVVTEASSFGLPVVASDAIGCVGPNDTVRPECNALVYPCGDRPRLREALLRLAEDGALRRRLGEASRDISEQQGLPAAAAALEEATRRLASLGRR